MDLELEIRNKETEYKTLKAKHRSLKAEKLATEKKLEALTREISELKEKCDFGGVKKEERVVDVTKNDDSGKDLVTRLMTEDKVLECDLLSKFKDLPGPGGSPCNYTPCKLGECLDRKVDYNNTQRVKRRLTFKRENSPNNNQATKETNGNESSKAQKKNKLPKNESEEVLGSERESESEDSEEESEIREKGRSYKWDSKTKMLEDFGKDTELLMKAVCALYRKQTPDEKFYKKTLHKNGRGFSQDDAYRGTELAEFLLDGDSLGEPKKSKVELVKQDSEAFELCKELAQIYSVQLFAIYENKEDPLFMP